ncbi:unnamed protein product [Lampetra fluviatilis]
MPLFRLGTGNNTRREEVQIASVRAVFRPLLDEAAPRFVSMFGLLFHTGQTSGAFKARARVGFVRNCPQLGSLSAAVECLFRWTHAEDTGWICARGDHFLGPFLVSFWDEAAADRSGWPRAQATAVKRRTLVSVMFAPLRVKCVAGWTDGRDLAWPQQREAYQWQGRRSLARVRQPLVAHSPARGRTH